ncbi:hypothetical protein Tco_1285028 [Tanacetum coccineum]
MTTHPHPDVKDFTTWMEFLSVGISITLWKFFLTVGIYELQNVMSTGGDHRGKPMRMSLGFFARNTETTTSNNLIPAQPLGFSAPFVLSTTSKSERLKDAEESHSELSRLRILFSKEDI